MYQKAFITECFFSLSANSDGKHDEEYAPNYTIYQIFDCSTTRSKGIFGPNVSFKYNGKIYTLGGDQYFIYEDDTNKSIGSAQLTINRVERIVLVTYS